MSAWSSVRVRSIREGAAFFFRNHGPVYSAAIAFNILLSGIPVLFLVFAAVGLVIGTNDLPFTQLSDLLQDTFPYGARVLVPNLRNLFSAGATLGALGTVLLLLASFSATDAVHTSLAVMLMRKRQRRLARSIRFHVMLVLTLMLLAAAAIVVPPIWEGLFFLSKGLPGRFDSAFHALLRLVSAGLLLGIVFLGSVLSYRFLSPGGVRYRNAVTGSAIFLVLFQAIRFGFTFYIRKFSKLSLLYGSLFSIVCFILMSYLSAGAYLYGASVIGALERMAGEESTPEGRDLGQVDEAGGD
jgi:membrane protein